MPTGRTMLAASETETSDELSWLYELLGANQAGATVDYLGRPTAEDLRLLVPTAPPAAAAAALRRLHHDRSWSERFQASAGRVAGRLGLLRWGPGQHLVLPQFELVDHLAQRLGEPELLAAVTLGARRRNRKPVLQLLRPDGRVVGFAKVGWSPLTHELVTNEHDILRAIAGRLPGAVVAPSVLALEHWRGLVVAVISELRPPAVAAGRPVPDATIVRAIAACGPDSNTEIASLAVLAEGSDVGLDTVVDVDRLLDHHGDLILATGLWHGDFTPWNLVQRGGTVMIWDWEFAGWGRPIGFDLLHSLFENHRRRSGGTNESALRATTELGGEALASLGLNLDEGQRRAMIDLYLCELLVRELRLSDQRWSGGELATLKPQAADVLRQRLR